MPIKKCSGCGSAFSTELTLCSKCGGELVVPNMHLNETQKDSRYLLEPEYASMISQSEEVKYSCDCSIRGKGNRAGNYVGKVVVTDKNVYLLKRRFKAFGSPDPLTKESFSLSQITGLDTTFEKYLTVKSYHVRLTRANNEDELYGLSQHAATRLVEVINEQMHAVNQNSDKSSSGVLDPIEQLTKLAALLEKGFITKEEFDKKKQELL